MSVPERHSFRVVITTPKNFPPGTPAAIKGVSGILDAIQRALPTHDVQLAYGDVPVIEIYEKVQKGEGA